MRRVISEYSLRNARMVSNVFAFVDSGIGFASATDVPWFIFSARLKFAVASFFSQHFIKSAYLSG